MTRDLRVRATFTAPVAFVVFAAVVCALHWPPATDGQTITGPYRPDQGCVGNLGSPRFSSGSGPNSCETGKALLNALLAPLTDARVEDCFFVGDGNIWRHNIHNFKLPYYECFEACTAAAQAFNQLLPEGVQYEGCITNSSYAFEAGHYRHDGAGLVNGTGTHGGVDVVNFRVIHPWIAVFANRNVCGAGLTALNIMMSQASRSPTGSPVDPTLAPSQCAPTHSPTTSPTTTPSQRPTTPPTVGPSPRPVLNSVADCGRHHVSCDGELSSPYQGSGITCPMPAGNPNGRCVCDGPYHCRGTAEQVAAERGACADQRDHCLERGITASPTALPTTSNPSAAPTASPSAAPASSVPTTAPTVAPTRAPSGSPTMTYPTDDSGRPILPTDPSGNEVYITDQWQQPIIPLDQWGNAIQARTISPTTEDVPLSPSGEASEGNDGDGADVVLVVIAAAVVLTLVFAGAVWFVKKNAVVTAPGPVGFDNPAYATATGGGGFSDPTYAGVPEPALDESLDESLAVSGYMDVPAAPGAGGTGYMDVAPATGSTGYMDVAPAMNADDQEEDV